MRVEELIELLKRFHPQAEVRLSLSLSGRVIATQENLWVADYGGGPQLMAALDFKPFRVYVGCGLEQFVTNVPPYPFDPAHHEVADAALLPDLGNYENAEIAARVRDFFNFHRRPEAPLADPDFDYAHWIAPRTTTGEYNEHIAAILRERLLRD